MTEVMPGGAGKRLAAERAAATERLAGLEREFTGLVESVRQSNADDEHDPEGATIGFERQHIAALVSLARERLAEIDKALVRLADSRYGTCEQCVLPIGAERLAARPAARTCFACATPGRIR
jgi:RNA polymerase-binding transcription factor DksA